MKTISLTEYFASKIEQLGGYPASSVAEDIIESIRLRFNNELVELTDEEYHFLHSYISNVIATEIEPLAKKTVKDWDKNARENEDERREGLYGKY